MARGPLRVSALLPVLVLVFAAAPAIADPGSAYPHLEARAGFGRSLRLLRSGYLGQDRLAPPYLELGFAATVGETRGVRHGGALVVASGVAGDGGLVDGVEQLEQWVLTPGYAARVDRGRDSIAGAHGGPSLVLSPQGITWGGELALSLAHRWLAGLGGYAELVFGYYAGADASHHPLLGLELGLFMEGEVLP